MPKWMQSHGVMASAGTARLLTVGRAVSGAITRITEIMPNAAVARIGAMAGTVAMVRSAVTVRGAGAAQTTVIMLSIVAMVRIAVIIQAEAAPRITTTRQITAPSGAMATSQRAAVTFRTSTLPPTWCGMFS